MGVVDSATRSEIPRADHGHVRHPANILQCAELRARIYAAHYCDGLRAVTAHLMATDPFRSRASRFPFSSCTTMSVSVPITLVHVSFWFIALRSILDSYPTLMYNTRLSSPRTLGEPTCTLLCSSLARSRPPTSDLRPPTSFALSRVPTRGP